MSKTNLTDAAWHSPTNEASRFFKVVVEMRQESARVWQGSGARGGLKSAGRWLRGGA